MKSALQFGIGNDRNAAKGNRKSQRLPRRLQSSGTVVTGRGVSPFYSKEEFHRVVEREKRRTERTGRSFMLVQLEVERLLNQGNAGLRFRNLLEAMHAASRETDIGGWIREEKTAGLLYVETDRGAASKLKDKITRSLMSKMGSELAAFVEVSVLAYPSDEEPEQDGESNGEAKWSLPTRPLPVTKNMDSRMHAFSEAVRRGIDIAASSLGIILFAPVFLGVAILIRRSSPGPVFFRQERLGYRGSTFTFLKFRSMYVDNDQSLHREYVSRFIAGNAEKNKGMFKITDDPRVTPVGRFLRKTSLDELPQLFNVLRGEMTLVGPRPPIPYEVEKYHLWHARRVLDVKPGLTGPWQVSARSLSTFDEMVRMDLRYISERSFWGDIRLIFQTPFAMAKGAA